MPDFDATVAPGAKGYDPQDAVAPLQALLLAQQGRNVGAEADSRDISNQLAQATLASKQSYAKTLATPGSNLLAGLTSSGMGAYDPEGAGKALSNIQAGRTQNAFDAYGQTHDPYSLAAAGPEAVGHGATAQNTQATTAQTNQATAGTRQEQLGMLGASFLQSDQSEGARQTIMARAHDMSLFIDPATGKFNNLLYETFRTMPLSQFAARARQFAASGATSAQTSGLATGAQEAAKFPYDHFSAPATDTVHMGSAWRNGPPPPGGFANPAPVSGAPVAGPQGDSGRSVATNSTVPAAPSNGGQGNPGWVDQATPEQKRQGRGAPSAQPALMTQAENAYGLPTNYLGRTAQIESGGRANASNPSGASGLFQFVPSTWARYGDPGTSPLNPQAATVAAARLAADNSATLTKALGRPPTGAELYLAHQQGAGGAAALLSNPSAPAASIVGAKAVISNGGTPNMTAGQFASMWERKFDVAGNSGNFTLSGPSPMGQGVSMPTPEASSTLPGGGGVGLRAAAAPQPTARPDLAPAVPNPIQLRSSTQPMPNESAVGRSASVPAVTPSANPNAPITERGMTPFEMEKQHLDAARAVEEEKDARNQFISAGDAQRGLMQLQEDLTKLTPGPNATLRDTLLAPGSGADGRIGFAKAINTALSTIGGQPLFDPDKITAAESANKTSGRLGFDLAGGLGGGSKAGFIVNEAIHLNPGVMNSPGGAKLLIGSLLASQQRQKDLYLFQQQFAEANHGNPIGAEIEFDQSHSPMHYVQDAQRLARVPLPAVKVLQAHPDQGTISAFNQKYGPSLARYYLGSRTD